MVSASRTTFIVTPVYNDWVAFERLAQDLDSVLREARIQARILAVDDASTHELPDSLAHLSFDAIEEVQVLRLRRNLGHQRAIAVGLAFLSERVDAEDEVVVMDSDGEDSPRDVPKLLEAVRQNGGHRVVFAERTRRSESLAFRAWYVVYRVVHSVLTGRRVRFGNFSALPAVRLQSLVAVAELWNHYAAAVVKSRQPYCTVATTRAKRLHGASRMNFVDLVVHGLSAISVYSDLVGVRLLVGLMGLGLGAVGGIGVAVGLRLFTGLAIPGWATTVVGFLAVLLFQALLFSVFLTFLILGGRQATSFVPIRDYSFFVLSSRTLYPRP
jgi:glycosyltransferase involved in cell wall biosynthesis